MSEVETNQIMELLRDMAKDLEELKQQAIRQESKQIKCEKYFDGKYIQHKEFPQLWEIERKKNIKNNIDIVKHIQTLALLFLLFKEQIISIIK